MSEAEISPSPTVDGASYYAYLSEHPVVKQAYSTYSWTKDSHPVITSTLNRFEEGITNVRDYATQKAVDSYNSYYVQPKKTISDAYNTGAEKTKNAVETGKNAVVVGGTLGLGAAVVVTQFSLALSAGGAAILLDGVDAAHGASKRAVNAVRQAEKAVEQRIYAAVEQAQRIALVPIDRITESSNALLDILDTVVERALAVQVPNLTDATVRQRVSSLASTIVQALSVKAHTTVIDPLNAQLRGLLESLSKSLVLVDVVRSKQEWVVEKVEELSASVSDLKTQIEREAQQYKQQPEVLLMRSIRNTSEQLRSRLRALREKGHSVFGDGSRVDSAIDYLERLDGNLAEADNVYKVRDEVISEARQRIAELTTWTTNLVVRQSPASA